MEIHSSWQTQLELKTRKIKKKESKWTKQNMENKRNKSVVVKELNHAWIQTQEALMQMRGRKRNSGATRKHSCKCASGFSMQSNQQKTKTTQQARWQKIKPKAGGVKSQKSQQKCRMSSSQPWAF